MPRDYYEILGIERSASGEEVKKAYRVLALKFHPDRNPEDPEAGDRFKEATEAYEVLSHEEKRRAYDRFGHAGVRPGAGPGFDMPFDLGDALRAFMRDFGDSFAMGGASFEDLGRGDDLRVQIRLSLREVVTGAKRTIKIRQATTCGTCGGAGGAHGSTPEACNSCRGTGQVRRVQRSFFGQFVNVGPCPNCRGRGKRVREPCPDCAGEGRVRAEVSHDIEIPPGVDAGNYLNLRGKGDAGSQGARSGDLHVLIDVEEMDGFERHDRDLLTELVVTPARAVLGGKLTVATLDGTATLEVPAGVQHGTLLRLKGKGLPPLHGGTRGSQLVRVVVKTPERLDRERKKLYEKLLELEKPGEDGA